MPCALISPTIACAARALSRAAAAAAIVRSVSTPSEIIAISGTTSVLATPFVVIKDRACAFAIVSCAPMASGSVAMKARWASGRRKRKVDMRNLSEGGRLGVERAPKAKVSFAVGAFSTGKLFDTYTYRRNRGEIQAAMLKAHPNHVHARRTCLRAPPGASLPQSGLQKPGSSCGSLLQPYQYQSL